MNWAMDQPVLAAAREAAPGLLAPLVKAAVQALVL
jgi:hypothetical protein